MEIQTTEEKDVIIVHVHGRVNSHAETDDFRKVIEGAMKDGWKKVVIDLSHVDWMNSTGIAMLVRAYVSLTEAKSKMHIAGANNAVQSVMKTTKLDTVFGLYPTAAEAAAELRKSV